MADEVLSQAQIDALLAQNTAPDAGEVSPEVEALLTKGGEAKPDSIFSKKVAAMAPPAEEVPAETASAGRTIEKTVREAAAPAPITSINMLSILEGADPSQRSTSPQQTSTNVKGPGQATPQHPGAAPAQASDAVVKSLQMMVETFSLRMEKVEALFNRVSVLEKAVTAISQQQALPGSGPGGANVQHLEREIVNIQNAVRSLTQNLRNTTGTLDHQGQQLSDVARNLDGTPAYGIRHTFECGHCGSRGHVGEYVTCTECGEGTWWGWWPD